MEKSRFEENQQTFEEEVECSVSLGQAVGLHSMHECPPTNTYLVCI